MGRLYPAAVVFKNMASVALGFPQFWVFFWKEIPRLVGLVGYGCGWRVGE